MELLAKQAVRPGRGWIALALALAVLIQAGPVCGVDLSIVETVTMDFGAVLDDDGAVVLGLADAITADPAGIHVGGAVFSGQYTISGDPFAAFSLSVAGSSASGLTLDTFVTSEGVPPLLSVALNGFGEMDLQMGATLTVDEVSAAPGLDQPLSYTITVDYN